MEILLAIKLMIKKAEKMENSLKQSKNSSAKFSSEKAEVFSLFMLMDIFSDSLDFASIRMLCPLLLYLKLLRHISKSKNAKILWDNPSYQCIESENVDQFFALQKNELADEHLAFFSEYLAKNGPSDPMIEAIREKAGAMAKMQNLLGYEGLFEELWPQNELRVKIFDRKCKSKINYNQFIFARFFCQ